MSNESIPIRLTGPLCKAMPIGTELVGDEGYWKGASYVKTTPSTWAMFMGRPTPADLWEAVEARRNNLSPFPSGLAYVYEPPVRPGATPAPDDPEVLVGDSYFRLSEVPAYAERLLASLTEEQQKSKELHIALTEMAPAPSLPTQDADATPAPIDPTTIRKGSKVFLEDGPEADANYVGGTVGHVNENGFVIIDHLGSFAVEELTEARHAKNYRIFRLTKHQPATEPEPEWAGRFVSAVIDVDTDGRRFERRSGFVSRSSGSEDALYLLGHGDYQTRRNMSEVEDVRPLVVIDPADVDVDALNIAALKAYMDDSSVMTADGVRAAVGVVLAKLGIEATR